jgi:hypothetical protein
MTAKMHHFLLLVLFALFHDINADPFVDEILSFHNFKRANHGSRPLTWDPTLASAGQQHSSGCKWGHSGQGYGENIMAGWNTPTDGLNLMYEQRKHYDYTAGRSTTSETTGHFTQIVWRATERIGCGQTVCADPALKTFIVCEYEPPGNVAGAYRTNVFPEGTSMDQGSPPDQGTGGDQDTGGGQGGYGGILSAAGKSTARNWWILAAGVLVGTMGLQVCEATRRLFLMGGGLQLAI